MPSIQDAEPHANARRILVVDDDEVMRDLLHTLLEMEGYVVTACRSGEIALDVLQTQPPPAIVLTDMQMPGLTGVEFVAALRSSLNKPPIMLGMSADAPSPEMLAQLDGFLRKPFDMPELQHELQRARDRTQGLQESFAPSPAIAADERSVDAPMEGAPVLDEGILSALAKTLQAHQMRELYNLTLNDVHKRFTRIQQYAAAGDLEAVQREAHAIKGSCGMVGARELQALATTLEGGTPLNTPVFQVFPSACDRLRRMLDEKFPTH